MCVCACVCACVCVSACVCACMCATVRACMGVCVCITIYTTWPPHFCMTKKLHMYMLFHLHCTPTGGLLCHSPILPVPEITLLSYMELQSWKKGGGRTEDMATQHTGTILYGVQ